MGSKGSQTTNTNQQSSYTPAQPAYNAILGALGQAQNVAQTPFSTPAAPVAGFSQQQQQAFGETGAAQGYAQPYINQAQQYLSPQGTQQFYNPMASNVTAQLQNIYGQQQQQTTGNLTQAAGGVGADRIAVGQSELANQQGLAAGQTYANLYGQAAGQAQTAAFGEANLGTAGQNAALSGASALLGTGGLQQQETQAQLNSPYQQQLQQIAWPYQNAQFLSGITGALAPGLGGTTTGTGSTTYPGASWLSSLAGLGLTGAGIYGLGNQQGWWGGSGSSPTASGSGGAATGTHTARGGRIPPGSVANAGVIGYASGGSPDPNESNDNAITATDAPTVAAPQSNPYMQYAEIGQLAAAGGGGGGGGGANANLSQLPTGVNAQPINNAPQSIVPQVQQAQIQPTVPQVNLNTQQQSGSGSKGSEASSIGSVVSSAAKIAAMFKQGGSVDDSPDDQRHLDALNQWNARRDGIDAPAWHDPEPIVRPGMRVTDPQGTGRDVRAMRRGGGTNPYAFADGGSPNDQVASAFSALPAGGFVDPAQYNALQDYGAGDPAYIGSGNAAPHMADIPTPRPRPSDMSAGDVHITQDAADPTEDDPATVSMTGAGASTPSSSPYAAPSGAAPSGGSARARGSASAAGSPWMALLTAGLGTLAASGQRDSHGLPMSPLSAIGAGGLQGVQTLEAQRAASQKEETIDQGSRRLDQEAQQHLDQLAQAREFHDVPSAYQKGMLAVQQQRYTGGLFDPETVNTMAQQALAGDKSVFSNLSRGVAGPQNIVQVRQRMNELAHEAGYTGADIASLNANFSAQSAAARSAAVREANVSTAVEEANQTFPLAREASAALPRSQFTTWNAMVQAAQAHTSSPELAHLVTALQGARTAYSQAMSRTGVNSVHAQEAADGLLSQVTDDESLNATLDQMEKEMHAAKVAPELTRQAILARISGHGAAAPAGGAAAPAGGATAPTTPTAPMPTSVRQNGHLYNRQPDGSYKAAD